MFMNDISNQYTYLNAMKNVVHEETIGGTTVPERRIIINSALAPVLDKLTSVRPTWRFKSTEDFSGVRFGVGLCVASVFDIYDGDESLGSLWVDRHWQTGDNRFYFNNFRLKNLKKRISYTTKPAEAVKRIVKAFHLKTPSERASDAFAAISRVLSDATVRPAMALQQAKTSIQRAMFDYACHHWDEVKTYPAIDPAIDLPALVQADKTVQQMSSDFRSGRGVTVCVEANGSYLVSRRSDAGYVAEVFKDSTLSDHLRGALGLLKMMDDASHIPDVGVRTTAKLFFVLDKKEE